MNRSSSSSSPSLGAGIAALVIVGAVLPSAGIGLLAAGSSSPPPAHATTAPPAPTPARPVVDVDAVTRALDAVDAEASAGHAARAALEKRAIDAERGDRLRLLARAIAKARDARRSAGKSGAELRGPFPVDELGDLGFLGLDAGRRWLLDRDGAVLWPVGVTAPAALATKGRDEDATVVDADVGGTSVRLVRRCVANEGYCLVDVEGVTPPAAPPPPTASLRAALAPLFQPTPAPSTPAPAPASSSGAAPSVGTAPASPWPVVAGLGLAALGLVCAFFAALRVRGVGSEVRRAALRLRAGLVGRPPQAPGGVAREFAELHAAIDEAHRAVGDAAARAAVDDARRDRLSAVADALEAARSRGGVARVDVTRPDDVGADAAVVRVITATNALLDALDQRALRLAARLAELDDHHGLLSTLAQRLLRLARVPGVPSPLSDELTSLGEAVAAKCRETPALALREEVLPITPSNPTALDRVAALRDLPVFDVARLSAPAGPGAGGGESAASPDRPND